MPELQLGLIEARFADLIWANAPVTTSALVKLAEAELHLSLIHIPSPRD